MINILNLRHLLPWFHSRSSSIDVRDLSDKPICLIPSNIELRELACGDKYRNQAVSVFRSDTRTCPFGCLDAPHVDGFRFETYTILRAIRGDASYASSTNHS
jgi:hypothetical protein